MIRLIFTLLAFSFAKGASGEGRLLKDFTKQIYVLDVGQLKLEYRYNGEPISRPRSLDIWVKCQGKTEWEPVGMYLMCELVKYDYEAGTKKLLVKYNDARVNQRTGESFCDQLGEGELSLGTLCVK